MRHSYDMKLGKRRATQNTITPWGQFYILWSFYRARGVFPRGKLLQLEDVASQLINLIWPTIKTLCGNCARFHLGVGIGVDMTSDPCQGLSAARIHVIFFCWNNTRRRNNSELSGEIRCTFHSTLERTPNRNGIQFVFIPRNPPKNSTGISRPRNKLDRHVALLLLCDVFY